MNRDRSLPMRHRTPTPALALAAALACFSFPALAESSSAAAASSSRGAGPARFSETIGIATPGKRIVGTTRDQGPHGPAASDEQLLNKVVGALVRDPAMQGADIEVSVEDGQVTLDGKAKDSTQADHAQQVAESLAGNGKVTSKLSTAG
jgi:osmotically-inducible protein OsmY